MRYLFFVSVLLFSVRLFASISESEMLDFNSRFGGNYRILEADGDMRIGGSLSVKADTTQIAFEFSMLDSSGPLGSNDLSFILKESKYEEKNKKYTLDFVGTKQEHYTAIFEELSSAFIQINWTKCTDKGCLLGFLKASKGGAEGTKIDVKEFFKTISGKYTIDYAGSKPPKDPGKEFLVADISDPNEAVIEAPYCTPDGSFCDLGYRSFSYANTEVYRKEISTTETLYTFLVKETPMQVFHWEDRSTKVLFRNYQYTLAKKVMCLEHIASK